jgi:lipopolysaccharide export LptBFGC system permease protein LptF
MGLLMLIMPDTMGETLVGAEKAAASPEILEMGTMFHYGLAPALLMIGLLLIFARSCAMETAKQLLLAYVISTGVLLGVFFGVFTNQDAIQFSAEMAAPDVIAFALALFAYLKGK